MVVTLKVSCLDIQPETWIGQFLIGQLAWRDKNILNSIQNMVSKLHLMQGHLRLWIYQTKWNQDIVGPADTLWECHASSSTRLFPVEMSRARKSSETICPDRFCGPPQHSKGRGGGGERRTEGELTRRRGATEKQVAGRRRRRNERVKRKAEGRSEEQKQRYQNVEKVSHVWGEWKKIKSTNS